MTRTPVDDLLASAQVRPDDPPATAAALLWRYLAARHDVPVDSPLAPLPVLDRVVLVLLDVLQLTDTETAAMLGTDAATVVATHVAARAAVGLPPSQDAECPEWEYARSVHRFGDPAIVADILEHVDGCEDCGGTARELGTVRRWWARRAVLASPAAFVGAFGVAPAFAATAAAAAALAVGALVWFALGGPTPDDPMAELPVPVLVEDQPVLPSDEEPSEGWPSPDAPPGETDATGDGGDLRVEQDADDAVDTVDDTVEDVTDTVTEGIDDALDDPTGTVEDTVDDVTDTVDDATDAVDDLVDDATDTVEDVTGTVDDVTDGLRDGTEGLPGGTVEDLLEPVAPLVP